jgi:hypothetical protein
MYTFVYINFAVASTKNVHATSLRDIAPKRALWADEHVLMSSYKHVLRRSSHKIAPGMILNIEQNLYVIVRV